MDEHQIWVDDQSENQKKWIRQAIDKLNATTIKKLAESATAARKLSYSPYSQYRVGAAVLATNGKIYQGANFERASYSETVHAEETAIINAMLDDVVTKQGRRFVAAIAISHPGDSASCGHCRQILAEHADNCLVIIVDEAGVIRKVTSLKTLMPYGFTPTDLGIV